MDDAPDSNRDAHPDRPRNNARTATTATLGVMLLCVVIANKMASETPPQAAARHSDVAAARIVDPAFCQNQTWPYFDARCLKRVDDQKPAASTSAVTDSATTHSTAAVAPAKQPDPTQAIQTPTAPVSTADQPVNAQLPAPSRAPAQTPTDPPAATASPAPAALANGNYGSQRVIGDAGSPPAAAPNTFADDTVVDPSTLQRQHHYHHRRSFFGFRF